MSWMDSWSRPKKSSATPPPLYLVQDSVRYCHACGRVIGSRKSQSAKASTSEVKYCSDRCKRHKLRAIDHQIEATFAALLDGQEVLSLAVDDVNAETPTVLQQQQASRKPAAAAPPKHKKVKGDPRVIIPCSEVETLVFGSRDDPEKVFGRKRNRARRGVKDGEVWKSVDMEGEDTDPGSVSSVVDGSAGEGEGEGEGEARDEGLEKGSVSDADEVPLASQAGGGVALRVRPPQSQSDVNFSVGGERGWAEKIEETPEALLKRREGQKRAEQKEMVKSAARRAVVFGLQQQGQNDKNEEVEGKGKKGRKTGDVEKVVAQPDGKRLCEAVMNGAVVEPSYAKGDWGIRWRAD